MTKTVGADVSTASASRYLQQLCKHWSHKFEVTFDDSRGHISLPFGKLDLIASPEMLTVSITAPEDADFAQAQKVVEEHLNRFAFREGELIFDWRPPS